MTSTPDILKECNFLQWSASFLLKWDNKVGRYHRKKMSWTNVSFGKKSLRKKHEAVISAWIWKTCFQWNAATSYRLKNKSSCTFVMPKKVKKERAFQTEACWGILVIARCFDMVQKCHVTWPHSGKENEIPDCLGGDRGIFPNAHPQLMYSLQNQ